MSTPEQSPPEDAVAERPFVREYIVSEFDLTNVVYRGPDRDAALAAWDAAEFPDCFVNEHRTYRLDLSAGRDGVMNPSLPDDPAQSRAEKIAAAIVPDQLDQYLPAESGPYPSSAIPSDGA